MRVVIAAKVPRRVREGLRFVADENGTSVSRILADLAEQHVREKLVGQPAGPDQARHAES